MNEIDELFEEVLALCLDRLADGDSPEDCALDFPEFPDLLPMLEIAAELRTAPRPRPRATWLKSSRARIEGRIRGDARN